MNARRFYRESGELRTDVCAAIYGPQRRAEEMPRRVIGVTIKKVRNVFPKQGGTADLSVLD